MDRFFDSKRFENGWHPGEDELLCFVDGEVPADTSTEIETHLEACWTCRAKTDKIQRTISSFVGYLNDGLLPNIDPPPREWRTFDARMKRVADETANRPLLFRWYDLVRNLHLPSAASTRWTASLLGILGIVFLFAHLQGPSPLSANQVIQRATEAQERRLQRVAHPVVYKKLRVERRESTSQMGSSVTWEIWNDAVGGGFRQRVEDSKGKKLVDPKSESTVTEGGPPHREPAIKDPHQALTGQSDHQDLPSILQDLDQVLQSNRMNRRDPLSPAGYASWRNSIRRQSEEVRETILPDGERGLTLLTAALPPPAVDSIVRAELVIRVEDWHPVAHRFQVQGQHGTRNYDLTETEFQILASNALPHSIFEDTSVASPLVLTPPATPPSAVLLPDRNESVASEVETLFALHRVRACMGRPISVVRAASGRIEVKGIVDTNARKAELLETLKGIPWINTRIQTIEEMPAETSQGAEYSRVGEKNLTLSTAEQNANTRSEGHQLIIQDLLEEYFASKEKSDFGQQGSGEMNTQQKIAALSHDVVSFSEAALEQAWALRRLAELSSSLKNEVLRTSSRRLLELMVRDHLNELQKEIIQARTLARPVLSGLVSDRSGSPMKNSEVHLGTPGSEDSGWAQASLRVFSAVDRMVRLTLGLFADTSFPLEARDETMGEVLQEFDRLEHETHKLDREVSQFFSEKTESITSLESKGQ